VAATTLDTISKILHIYYARFLTAQTNDRTHIRDMFDKDARKFDGSVLRMGLVDSYPVTGGARGPSATIPGATNTDVETSDIFLTYHYYPIEVDWDVEEQSSGPHAWIRASALEIERVRKWALVNFERQMLGDGSGMLAGEDNPAASNTLPLVDIDQTGGPSSELQFTIDTRYGIRFHKNMRLEFWDSGGAGTGVTEAIDRRDGPSSGQSYFTVATVVHSGGTTTVTMAETIQGTANDPGDNEPTYHDYVSLEGAITEDFFGAGGSAGHETPGLKALIGDGAPPLRTSTKNNTPSAGTMQGVDPTTTGYWQSSVIDGTNNQILGPGIFEEVSQNLQLHGSQGIDEIDCMITHPLQVSKFRRTLYPMERFTVQEGTPSLPSGAKSSMTEKRRFLTWGGVPIVPSRFCDPDRCYFVNKSHIKIYENTPFKFAAADGSMWQRDPNGRASYKAVAYKYEGAGLDSRNLHAVAENLDTANV
jgi:hypothetical protein